MHCLPRKPERRGGEGLVRGLRVLGSESVGGVLCRSGSVASSGDAALAKARARTRRERGVQSEQVDLNSQLSTADSKGNL